jgi:hypothetical protein
LKVEPPTVVSTENDSAVLVEVPKNAVPVGTAAGFQLAVVLKSAVPGLASQVAFCARAAPGNSAATAINAVVASSAAMRRFERWRIGAAGRSSGISEKLAIRTPSKSAVKGNLRQQAAH